MPAFHHSSYPGYDEAFDSGKAAFGVSSAVVRPSTARILSTSRQVGKIDVERKIVGGLEEQLSASFENVGKALLAAVPKWKTTGEAFRSVYEVTTYHVGGVAAAYEPMAQIAERLFGTSTRPVWTAVGVTDLLYEGQLVEI